jgi:polysaccharide export outer membrane protein
MRIASIILLSCLLFSCVTLKQIEYVQDKPGAVGSYREADFPDYKLKPNDELFIQVRSLDEAAANVFSNETNQQFLNAGTIQPYGASLMSYSVDRDGYLLLPIIGRIMVKDKTISDVGIEVRDSLHHILNQPVVTIKLVNRFISVLGEVNSPGHFSYSQDKLTVFDAVGLAGDITEYGNRNKVTLIRNENGVNQKILLNLRSSDILTSEYYNLRPNDIVYVKPMGNKFWGMRQFPFTVLFSALTTGILLYNVVR